MSIINKDLSRDILTFQEFNEMAYEVYLYQMSHFFVQPVRWEFVDYEHRHLCCAIVAYEYLHTHGINIALRLVCLN